MTAPLPVAWTASPPSGLPMAACPGRDPSSISIEIDDGSRPGHAAMGRPEGGEAVQATGRGAVMEMAYRERWEAEIAEMRRVLAGFAMREECKWGKPTYTVDGKNIVILQDFKEYFALGFFQGALLKDPKKVLVQLGQEIGRASCRERV